MIKQSVFPLAHHLNGGLGEKQITRDLKIHSVLHIE
jgi:hypothetical protein